MSQNIKTYKVDPKSHAYNIHNHEIFEGKKKNVPQWLRDYIIFRDIKDIIVANRRHYERKIERGDGDKNIGDPNNPSELLKDIHAYASKFRPDYEEAVDVIFAALSSSLIPHVDPFLEKYKILELCSLDEFSSAEHSSYNKYREQESFYETLHHMSQSVIERSNQKKYYHLAYNKDDIDKLDEAEEDFYALNNKIAYRAKHGYEDHVFFITNRLECTKVRGTFADHKCRTSLKKYKRLVPIVDVAIQKYLKKKEIKDKNIIICDAMHDLLINVLKTPLELIEE